MECSRRVFQEVSRSYRNNVSREEVENVRSNKMCVIGFKQIAVRNVMFEMLLMEVVLSVMKLCSCKHV